VGDRPGSSQGAVSFCSPASRSTSPGPISLHFLTGGMLERASQPRSAVPAEQTVAESASRVPGQSSGFSWDPGSQPPETPGPVCVFSCDTCFQPPNCCAGFLNFHWTLACSPQKRLGRYVTGAFSLQSAWAGFVMFMGPWPSATKPKCLGRLQSLWQGM
jgi:hypothetical protein